MANINYDDLTFSYRVESNGDITYTATADGKSQRLSGRDLTNKEALEADLANYTQAYVDGLKQQRVVAGSDITVGLTGQVDAQEIFDAQAAAEAAAEARAAAQALADAEAAAADQQPADPTEPAPTEPTTPTEV